MNKKISIQSQSDKKSPYRLKYLGLTVSLSTMDEAKRVRQFINKLLKVQGNIL